MCWTRAMAMGCRLWLAGLTGRGRSALRGRAHASGGVAPVDDELGTGDELGFVGGKIENKIGHFTGMTDPVQGGTAHVQCHAFGHWRGDYSRMHGVYPHAIAA